MSEPTSCICCDALPLVGHFGLCRDCADAVNRFIRRRGQNLRARKAVGR